MKTTFSTSWASYAFSAFHFDSVMAEGWHEHEWEVRGYWPSEPWRDRRAMTEMLKSCVESMIYVEDDQRRIPKELWTNEAIAQRLSVLGVFIKIHVTRPDSGVILICK